MHRASYIVYVSLSTYRPIYCRVTNFQYKKYYLFQEPEAGVSVPEFNWLRLGGLNSETETPASAKSVSAMYKYTT